MRLLVTLFAVSCGEAVQMPSYGDPDGVQNLPPGQSATCTVTLRGAMASTFDCHNAELGAISPNYRTGYEFAFRVDGYGNRPDITGRVLFNGRPRTGTYSSTTAGVDMGGADVHTVVGSPAQDWQTLGSWTLKLNVAPQGIDLGPPYTPTGTFDAILAPMSGQGGTITLHATF